MSLNKQIAVSTHHAQILYSGLSMDSKGRPCKVRVTGKCQTLKLTPDFYKLPVKYGLRTSFYILPQNAADWFLTEEEALAHYQSRKQSA